MPSTENQPALVTPLTPLDIEQLTKASLEYLTGHVPAEFPKDYSHATEPSSIKLQSYSFVIPTATLAALATFSGNLHAKEHAALVAAVRALHFRYTGIDDAAIGAYLYSVPSRCPLRMINE